MAPKLRGIKAAARVTQLLSWALRAGNSPLATLCKGSKACPTRSEKVTPWPEPFDPTVAGWGWYRFFVFSDTQKKWGEKVRFNQVFEWKKCQNLVWHFCEILSREKVRGKEQSEVQDLISETWQWEDCDVSLDFQNPRNTWSVGVWNPWNPSQEMFGGSKTYPPGIWMSRVYDRQCGFHFQASKWTSNDITHTQPWIRQNMLLSPNDRDQVSSLYRAHARNSSLT